MRRPKVKVLRTEALRSSQNRIAPPPTVFSHEIAQTTPYYLGPARQEESAGTLRRGTAVVMLRKERGGWCWVVDRLGRYVLVNCKALRPRGA